MKKFLIITLLCLYGLLSLGLRATLHTCCGEVTGFGVIEMGHACQREEVAAVCEAGHSACCSKKETEKKEVSTCGSDSKCCDEEEIYLFLDEKQISSKEQNPFAPKAYLASQLNPSGALRFFGLGESQPGPSVNDPPPNDIPIYLMFSSLIVYG